MEFNRPAIRYALKAGALFMMLLLACMAISTAHYLYLSVILPIVIYQLTGLISIQKRVHDEIEQFVQSTNSRDFSRHFNVNKAPAELQMLRRCFNEINTTFKLINRERETQYHYLQKIMTLVDTGIISYEQETGEINWMNEAFKVLLGIPYLKNMHAFEKREPALYANVVKLKPAESKLITFHRNRQQISILVAASAFKSDGKLYKLLAFQNVSEALDETESKAWQKLLNVMTHELMNSVAPISSLADTMKNRLQNPGITNNIAPGDLEDLRLGINTIKNRSEGLLKFTENYRSLNKISELNLTRVLITDLIENINRLMLPSLRKKNIGLEIIIKDLTLAIDIDISLIEQVLINLLTNAIEAVKDTPAPQIILSAELLEGKKTGISVTDNGIGIPAELLDKIFIPFFSTRKTGSGIGLSLCKQIMLLHRGNIQVQSVKGKGSAFLLQFNNN